MRALLLILPFLLCACAAAPGDVALDTALAADGTPRTLTAAPVFSPDNKRFLLSMAKDGDAANALEIWRRDGDDPVVEWAYSWQQAKADDPALTDASTIRVLRWDHTGRIDIAFSSLTGVLMRDEEGWHLRMTPPK